LFEVNFHCERQWKQKAMNVFIPIFFDGRRFYMKKAIWFLSVLLFLVGAEYGGASDVLRFKIKNPPPPAGDQGKAKDKQTSPESKDRSGKPGQLAKEPDKSRPNTRSSFAKQKAKTEANVQPLFEEQTGREQATEPEKKQKEAESMESAGKKKRGKTAGEGQKDKRTATAEVRKGEKQEKRFECKINPPVSYRDEIEAITYSCGNEEMRRAAVSRMVQAVIDYRTRQGVSGGDER
jgi:hypothetical protein